MGSNDVPGFGANLDQLVLNTSAASEVFVGSNFYKGREPEAIERLKPVQNIRIQSRAS